MQFKQLTASLVPEVISLLACTCPVARYINHVIQWCIEFPSHYAVHPKRFFLPFSLVFLLCCSPSLLAVFVSFFGGFSSGFFCLNITCHTLNSILASLESQGHTLSTSKSAPTNTSVSTSSSFLSPASVSISAEALSQGHFLSILAVAPVHVSGFSGERKG